MPHEKKDKDITYFSMFTGVGGFEIGFEGTKNIIINEGNSRSTQHLQSERNSSDCERDAWKDNKDSRTFRCIGFSEIDKYACELLARKFPSIKNYGNARDIDPKKLPNFDMLCGGFPCQAFSIAGKRKGFEDTRGTLFFEIARILKVKKPKVVFLENVKGLLNHDEGNTFTTILKTLSELGYDVQWMVLNSKFFGVPQNRERIFIIGNLREKPRLQILPFREVGSETPVLQGYEEVTNTVHARYLAASNGTYIESRWETPLELQEITENVSDAQRIYHSNGIARALKGLGGGQGAKTGLYSVPEGDKEIKVLDDYNHSVNKDNLVGAVRQTFKNSAVGNGIKLIEFHKLNKKTRDVKEAIEIAKELSLKSGKPVQLDILHLKHGEMRPLSTYIPQDLDTHRCLQAGEPKEILIQGVRIRRLTPLECERLQGFPDGWTSDFSDSQRYKMMGNAVTTNVIRAIGSKIRKNL